MVLPSEVNLYMTLGKILGGQMVPKGFAGLVGTSAAMQSVFQLIAAVAPTRHPVLIQGENGTGKELVVRAIHAQGTTKDSPFVVVDCGALTATLVESELFGHVRGAFTGANQNRRGLLAHAGCGTVFLDEITEIPVTLQAKLLRAIQEHEFRRVGGNEWTHFDARIVAATNQDIFAAVKSGSFREDLYYRLAVVSIVLPPLRDRRGDIPGLVNHFIAKYGGEEGRISCASDDAMTQMISHNWPGNIRELENCIQRAIVLGSGHSIRLEDLSASVLSAPHLSEDERGDGHKDEVLLLEVLEKKAITRALEFTCGNRQKAAKILGIGKTTIYRRLKESSLAYENSGCPRPPPAATKGASPGRNGKGD